MDKIRAAVIGVGYLGRFHAQKYAQLAECELVAVVDGREDVRNAVAAETGSRALGDYRELLGKVDAVSVVTPTPAHFEIADAFLGAGAHVLVEKPITETPDQARSLIARAAREKRILQVGHLERFNAAVLAAEPHLRAPRFMECHRLAPYKERGTDVNVVLDLMIHDIDLVQSLAGSELVSIDAIGSPVFSGEIDIANARLRFANGCVANTTASRVSLKTERKLRIFEDAAYISLDLQQKILTLIRKREGVPQAGQLPVTIEEANLEQGDALKSEIISFLDCIRNNRRPVVSGEDGLRALETAIRITDQVHANLGSR
jgi:predicted dehydrogenase